MAQAVEEFLQSLPEAVQQRLQEVKGLHGQYEELEQEYTKEIEQIEAKYAALYRPLFNQRADIVAGKGVDGDGVPGFWLHALQNHDEFANLITDKDAPVLHHLTDISSQDSEKGGFKLVFRFAKNDYFDHETLEKEYVMAGEDKDMLEAAVGTKISWKQGKDPTVKLMRKKGPTRGRGGRGGAGPAATKLEPVPSFFKFFSPPRVPTGEVPMDEQDLEDLQETLQEDYELGEILHGDIIPSAYLWFTGEAVGEEDDEEDDVDDEDDEDHDEDDDDEEEEEEDSGDATDDDVVANGASQQQKSKGGKALQDTAEKPQECKQQ